MIRMLRFLILLIVIPAQASPDQRGGFRVASATLTEVLDDRVSAIVPGPLLQRSKATYLEDYGMIVTIEIALEMPRNPFSAAKRPREVRQLSAERREALKEGAVNLLKENVAGLEVLSPDDWVTVVIHMLNTNPTDLPDLPTQLVISAKKLDVIAVSSGSISDAAFRDRLRVREY